MGASKLLLEVLELKILRSISMMRQACVTAIVIEGQCLDRSGACGTAPWSLVAVTRLSVSVQVFSGATNAEYQIGFLPQTGFCGRK